jgi:hypothetical protein
VCLEDVGVSLKMTRFEYSDICFVELKYSMESMASTCSSGWTPLFSLAWPSNYDVPMYFSNRTIKLRVVLLET